VIESEQVFRHPAANLGFVTVNEGGQAGTPYTSPRRPGHVRARPVGGQVRWRRFMENECDWHGRAPDDEQYAQAMRELEQTIGCA